MESSQAGVMNSPKDSILVIDDSEEMLIMQRIVLEMAGFVVFTAKSGAEALSMLLEIPQLSGRKFTPEAQVVAIANQFDHLTTMELGRAKIAPLEALELMIKENGADPVRAAFDGDLLKRLRDAYGKSQNSDVE